MTTADMMVQYLNTHTTFSLGMLLCCGIAGAAAGAMDVKKVGGIWFWKLGKIGGSVYLAKK